MSNNFELLLNHYPILSDQVDRAELLVLLRELDRLLKSGATGTVVEFGCYVGTTSLFIRRLLDAYQAENNFHVYDSFEGLPPKSAKDQSVAGDQFVEGELKAARKEFMLNFKKARLHIPFIHKGWFSDLTADDVPDNIMFAFLDGDYYESIKDSLRLITPKLAPGAVIIVDDYINDALPGAARATDEWAEQRHLAVRAQASVAIIRT